MKKLITIITMFAIAMHNCAWSENVYSSSEIEFLDSKLDFIYYEVLTNNLQDVEVTDTLSFTLTTELPNISNLYPYTPMIHNKGNSTTNIYIYVPIDYETVNGITNIDIVIELNVFKSLVDLHHYGEGHLDFYMRAKAFITYMLRNYDIFNEANFDHFNENAMSVFDKRFTYWYNYRSLYLHWISDISIHICKNIPPSLWFPNYEEIRLKALSEGAEGVTVSRPQTK